LIRDLLKGTSKFLVLAMSGYYEIRASEPNYNFRAHLKILIYYEPTLVLKGLARVNAVKYQLLEASFKVRR
jgi:hypothetical protein